MKTDCSYGGDQLHIATVISPRNQIVEQTLARSNLVLDASQVPLVVRTLPLKPGAEFKFDSLDPRGNSVVPLTIHVVGEGAIEGTECYKVEQTDFEGQMICWVEKTGHHRIMRFEEPAAGRTTELVRQ